MTKRSGSEDLREVARLIVEATLGVTHVVESMHRTLASGPAVLRPLTTPFSYAAVPVYAAVRGMTRLVGGVVDVALTQLAPLLSESMPGPERLALISALNGVVGDYLNETHSPLALEMAVCRNGAVLPLERAALRAALPSAGRRLLVLVHGSCMNDGYWLRAGHDHGAMLERELGYFAVYLRYNSGQHISTNGRDLARLLERLVAEWPEPIDELTLIGHSMGGLVSRSACDVAEREAHAWRKRLTRMICLGAPHHGAATERAGNWVDFSLGISRYSAPLAVLGKIRSAGVTDMRFGNVRDEDWMGLDRFQRKADTRNPLPLPLDVYCYAVAGTKSPRSATPLRSDGLVSVESALGKHRLAERTLAFPKENQFISFETDHLGLLNAPEVYATLRRACSGQSS